MTQNNELEMKVPRRVRSERARTSTGVGAPQGRRRTVDVDENNVYHSFSLKLSDSLNRRLGRLTGMNKANLSTWNRPSSRLHKDRDNMMALISHGTIANSPSGPALQYPSAPASAIGN